MAILLSYFFHQYFWIGKKGSWKQWHSTSFNEIWKNIESFFVTSSWAKCAITVWGIVEERGHQASLLLKKFIQPFYFSRHLNLWKCQINSEDFVRGFFSFHHLSFFKWSKMNFDDVKPNILNIDFLLSGKWHSRSFQVDGQKQKSQVLS